MLHLHVGERNPAENQQVQRVRRERLKERPAPRPTRIDRNSTKGIRAEKNLDPRLFKRHVLAVTIRKAAWPPRFAQNAEKVERTQLDGFSVISEPSVKNISAQAHG